MLNAIEHQKMLFAQKHSIKVQDSLARNINSRRTPPATIAHLSAILVVSLMQKFNVMIADKDIQCKIKNASNMYQFKIT